MRTLRLSLAGVGILVMCAALGNVVTAQEAQDESPPPAIDGQTVADMVNEAIATGDPALLEAIFAPDVLLTLDDEVVADGRDALMAVIPFTPNSYRQIGPVAEYVASDGDLYVATIVEVTGPGHPEGDPLIGFWRVHEGKVVRHVFLYAPDY